VLNNLDSNQVKSPKRLRLLLNNRCDKYSRREPKISLNDITDKIMKQSTGFLSVSAMICYVIIINKGDIDSIINNTTTKTMTWFEEWMVVLERLGGRSVARWCDASQKYGMSERHLATVFDEKIKLIIQAKKDFGLFVTYQEDKYLRQQKWETHFATRRLIKWDNTNVPLCFMPSDAEAQRNTYSQYYGGNVGKGGVFIQPCGWMGTHDLWMGAVSDTEYMLRSGIFEEQFSFVTERDPLSNHVPWLNMFDRGYRNIGEYARQHGKQLVVKPTFTRADERFKRYDTLRSAAIAAVRAGNERSVRYAKTSKFLKSGLKPNESCVRLCNVWISWGFQVNFMFRPVH
jgi:hypothetical protein